MLQSHWRLNDRGIWYQTAVYWFVNFQNKMNYHWFFLHKTQKIKSVCLHIDILFLFLPSFGWFVVLSHISKTTVNFICRLPKGLNNLWKIRLLSTVFLKQLRLLVVDIPAHELWPWRWHWRILVKALETLNDIKDSYVLYMTLRYCRYIQVIWIINMQPLKHPTGSKNSDYTFNGSIYFALCYVYWFFLC